MVRFQFPRNLSASLKFRLVYQLIYQLALPTALLFLAHIPVVRFPGESERDLPQVSLEAQALHATELLTAREPASLQTHLSSEQMAAYVFERVEGSLKGRWKSHAYRVASAIISEANHYEMDPLFILSIIAHESHFDPLTRGQHGEIGLMQMKPSTAIWLQQKTGLMVADLEDPVENIRAGTAYLSYLRTNFRNRSRYYIPAYNMGPRNVRDLAKQDTTPLEYSNLIMRYYLEYRREILDLAERSERVAAR